MGSPDRRKVFPRRGIDQPRREEQGGIEDVDDKRLWPGAAPGALGDTLEDTPRLTPYLDVDMKEAPAIVVCPGGGYGRRAPHEAEPIARWLNSLGIAAFVLDYRVAPYRHPIPLLDAQRAIRTVRFRAKDWGVDPARVGILGFSAGGHLAATAATQFNVKYSEPNDDIDSLSCRPDLAILCYPVITFANEFRHPGSMDNLLGPEPDQALRLELSAEVNVTADTPPTFLWHAADDTGVPPENSLSYAAALSRNGVSFAMHIFATGRHGLGLALQHPEAGAWTSLCATWLQEQKKIR